MKIVTFKRRNVLIVFAVVIIVALMYLNYSVTQIEEEAFVFNKNRISHQKLKNQEKSIQKRSKIYSNQCEWFQEQKVMNTDIQTADMVSKLSFDDINGGVWKQGFDIKYNPIQWSKQKKLHIFVVPHSHNDPGWLMTFEEYFHARTKGILDTIVNTLSEKTSRKFIWAETSYLYLWWKQASGNMRNKMRRLIVETKQLEIVTGGWVMNDEANSHYYAMIEQMIEGHEWLKSNIDASIQPTYGWSIDPFGYTPTMAYLLKQMGFDAMLIQRVHYSIKKYMAKENKLEFDWQQSWSTDKSKDTSLFCHVMPFYSYDVPHTCGPDPKICCQFDFARMESYGGCPWGIKPNQITRYNVEERAETLLDQYRKKAQLYGGEDNHNVVLIPLGDDFRYRDMREANVQFKNYEILMDYMNSREDWNVDIKFGTLKDYFELVKEKSLENNHKIDTFSGDFFTYADREHHYWSGYYTSRPFNKRLDRVVEYYLRSAEIIFSLANLSQKKSGKSFDNAKSLYKKMISARRDLGLFQHHDGVTGTSKTPVVNDYANKLYKCLTNSKDIIENSISFLTTDNESDNVFTLDDVQVKNNQYEKKEQFIDLSKTNEKKIVLYNSNLNERINVVKFKVSTPHVQVVDSEGKVLENIQISLLWPNVEGVDPIVSDQQRMTNTNDLRFAYDYNSNICELLFEVKVPGLSLSTFIIKKKKHEDLSKISPEVTFYHNYLNADQNKIDSAQQTILEKLSGDMKSVGEKISFDKIEDKEIKIDSGEHEVYFSQKSGFLKKILNRETKTETKSEIKFIKYGTTSAREKSGAYLFLPDGAASDFNYKSFIRWIRVEKNGKLRNRVCINLTILLHCVELYPTVDVASSFKTPLINIWNVVNLREMHNFEFAMQITSDIKNNDQFFTDLNGYQYTKRKNYEKLTIQGNVYPMPSGAYIQDSNNRLNVLSGQPLGVASQEKSSLQIFLDRRLDQDDNRGMEQAMNDNVLTTSKFLMFFEEVNKHVKSIGQYHPSLLSQTLSFDLINPIVKLILNNDESTVKSNIKLSKSEGFSCDLRLVNMRTMQQLNEEPEENKVGLIIHRLSHEDCQESFAKEPSGQTNSKCNTSSNTKFSDFFGVIETESMHVESTYLTLQTKEALAKKDLSDDLVSDHVEPMQIEGFKLRF